MHIDQRKPDLRRRVPLRQNGRLYNCAAVIFNHEIIGIQVKSYLPNYNEFYEKRWFSDSFELSEETIELNGKTIPFTSRLLIQDDTSGAVIGIDVCEDLWVPIPPRPRMCSSCRWQRLLPRAMGWCRPWRLPGNSVRRKPIATGSTACSGRCLNALNTSPTQRSVAGWCMPCIRLPAKRYFPSICGRKTVATGLRTLLYGILWVSSVPDRKTVCFSRQASACARPTCSIPLRLPMTNTCCS